MWPKAYKDYPVDTSLIQNKVEPGKGIIGCEMHDLNGWGNTLHIPRGQFADKVQPRVRPTQYRQDEIKDL